MRKNAMGGRGFAQHRSNRGDAPLDLVLHRVHRRAVETEQMVLAVGADGMALGEDAAGEVGIAAGHPAHQEIIGLHAMLGQYVEHATGVRRHRTVVEGQHDLFVIERQRLGILRRTDTRILSRVHRDHPLGAERVRIARTVIGARFRSRHCGKHRLRSGSACARSFAHISDSRRQHSTTRQLLAVIFNGRGNS